MDKRFVWGLLVGGAAVYAYHKMVGGGLGPAKGQAG